MFKSSYKIATVWGIPIKTNISLLFIIGYIAFSMSKPGDPLSFLFGICAGIILFTSIALHELGHSYVAIKKGCRVHEITLAIFGGVAKMESIPSRPKDEFQMAIAGPAVSLFLCLTGMCGVLFLSQYNATVAIQLIPFFWILGAWNGMLTVFNIIPAFPLDGGRVLRALLTPKRGKLKATYIASRIGKSLALLFGLYGLSRFFSGHESGIFNVIIAIFVYSGAENEYKLVKMQESAQWFWPDNNPQPDNPPWQPETQPDDTQVEISPPPYDDGPSTKSEIHDSNKDNPFTNPFTR